MKTTIKFFFIVFILFVAVPAVAQEKNRTLSLGTLLNAVASNAAAASRTFTVGPTLGRDHLLNYSKAVFEIFYDYTSSAGAVTMTCTSGQTVATANFQLTLCQTSSGSGVCTVNIGAGVFTTASLSADTRYSVVLGIAGRPALSCVMSHASPGAGEKFTVTGYLVKD